MLICYGLCGSFCTVRRSLAILETLKKQNFDLLPVCSFHFCSTDTRFGSAAEHLRKIEDICEKAPIVTLRDAEPIGPKYKPELMVIAPLTGNSLAKLNHGISDTPVTLAAKSHLRNNKPLLLGLATNDGLSGNFGNLADLYGRKNVFYVPLRQDDPLQKPNSLVCDFEKIPQAVEFALEGRQMLPLFEA